MKTAKQQVDAISSEVRPELLLKKLHSAEGKLAEAISRFAGSMMFAYFHFFWFSLWILANHGVLEPFIHPFDPFPYGLLTMIVSLEAIYLSTFIMISQNRQTLVDTYRELEEDQEQREEEEQQEEFEEEVEDIQKDLDDIKTAMTLIQTKLGNVEKAHTNATSSQSSDK
ncbi:MAG TPA: DUF1003 domain-containing protein [Patescibacteria group bacterium]|nr:DUF1003 domain-containing protein [Patescibacteria group bacterium]